MGNPIASTGKARAAVSFLTYTPSASSEAGGFAVSNVSDLGRPFRTWHSVGTAESWIVLDFGSANAPPAIFLDNVNFASVQIQGNGTDAWTTPAFPGSVTTLQIDPRLNRYKGLIDLTGFNYQFMRVLIPAQTPTDGAGFFKIGAAAVPAAVTELGENIEYPLRWQTADPHITNEFMTGGAEVVKIAESRTETLVLNVVRSNDDAGIKEVYDLFADQTRTILFDARLNVGYEVYLARVARPLEESWPAWNPRDFGELELRVV